MNNIQFSVIIPLYNKRNTIIQTLNSVRKQKLKPAEIIVVDDGSTDDGVKLIAQLNWPELKLIRQRNQGVSAARNKGALKARSPYLAFLDADDLWLPFFLEEMRQLITQFPQQALFASRYQKVAANEQFYDARIHLTEHSAHGYEMANYFELASKGDLPFMVSSMVVDRQFFINAGGFPKSEWMGEDQSFFIKAALKNLIAYSPQIHVMYQTDSENRASDKQPPSAPCPFAVRLMAKLKTGSLPTEQTNHVKAYIAAHICDLAKRNVKAGYEKVALKLLSHPLCKYKPLHKSYWSLRAFIAATINLFKPKMAQ